MGIGSKSAIGGFDLDRRISEIRRRFYVAYFIDLRCNYRCSYCIQDDINRKEYDKTEDWLKAIQSVGQIVGECLKKITDEKCAIFMAFFDFFQKKT